MTNEYRFCRGNSARTPLWGEHQKRELAAERAADPGVQSVQCAAPALLPLIFSLQQHLPLLQFRICASAYMSLM